MGRTLGLLLALALVLVTPCIASSVIPQLDVTVLRATPDTTWVAVKHPDVRCGGNDARCPPSWTGSLSVAPCPLNRSCPTGSYHATIQANDFRFIEPDTLALGNAVHYTMGGSYSCDLWFYNPSFGRCEYEAMVTSGTYPTIDFYGPTPARTGTWGEVKVRYR